MKYLLCGACLGVLFAILAALVLYLAWGPKPGGASTGATDAPSLGLSYLCQCVPSGEPTQTPTVTPLPVTPTPTPWAVIWDIPSYLPIRINQASTFPAFKITVARYQDAQHSGGNHNVYFRVEHENGTPLYGAVVCLAWPGGMDCSHATQDRSTDPYYPSGYMADYPLYGGAWDYTKGPGPYSVWVVNAAYGSEVLAGLGLPESQHVNYLVTFRLAL